MINYSTCSEKELWEHVAAHLSRQKLKPVLVGGSVAAIYSKGLYTSGDLDIVIDNYPSPEKKIMQAMESLGFSKSGRHWIHPDCEHLFVEFSLPPVAIGEDYQIEPIKIKTQGVSIFILSPTDSVRDRLAAYIHWDARDCLDQAVLVARNNKINFEVVKKWCRKEHPSGLDKYREFEERIPTSGK